jgi:excisionase family DNA binding protein
MENSNEQAQAEKMAKPRITHRRADPTVVKPLVVRRPEAAFILGCSVTTLDQRVARGEIAARKDGKILLFEMTELERYIRELPPATLKTYARK